MTSGPRYVTSISPMLLVFMLASLLLLPIDYRAGARLPHPHTTFQLLAELATGTVHHHGSSRHVDRAVGSLRDLRPSALAALPRTGLARFGAPFARARPPGMVIAAGDLPRLTEVHPTVNVAVAPLHSGPSVESLADRLLGILQWPSPLPWTAAVITPEPPPPRPPVS